MDPLIARNLTDIRTLARAFGVQRLEVLGSVMTDDFDPSRSDIDFIVTYPADYDFGPWLTRFIEFEELLAALLGRPVDLVMATVPVMSDKFFRHEADKTRQVVYDASEVAEVA